MDESSNVYGQSVVQAATEAAAMLSRAGRSPSREHSSESDSKHREENIDSEYQKRIELQKELVQSRSVEIGGQFLRYPQDHSSSSENRNFNKWMPPGFESGLRNYNNFLPGPSKQGNDYGSNMNPGSGGPMPGLPVTEMNHSYGLNSSSDGPSHLGGMNGMDDWDKKRKTAPPPSKSDEFVAEIQSLPKKNYQYHQSSGLGGGPGGNFSLPMSMMGPGGNGMSLGGPNQSPNMGGSMHGHSSSGISPNSGNQSSNQVNSGMGVVGNVSGGGGGSQGMGSMGPMNMGMNPMGSLGSMGPGGNMSNSMSPMGHGSSGMMGSGYGSMVSGGSSGGGNGGGGGGGGSGGSPGMNMMGGGGGSPGLPLGMGGFGGFNGGGGGGGFGVLPTLPPSYFNPSSQFSRIPISYEGLRLIRDKQKQTDPLSIDPFLKTLEYVVRSLLELNVLTLSEVMEFHKKQYTNEISEDTGNLSKRLQRNLEVEIYYRNNRKNGSIILPKGNNVDLRPFLHNLKMNSILKKSSGGTNTSPGINNGMNSSGSNVNNIGPDKEKDDKQLTDLNKN